MKFVADESLDGPVIRSIRDLGYQVLSIAETAAGSSDLEVLARAFEERAILLTEDKDFGDLIFRHGYRHFGVVLVRLSGRSPAQKAALVSNHIVSHGTGFEMAFSVITSRAIRIRQTRHSENPTPPADSI
jgi:predicted nuclease of predicted toxin-antitoxin system